MIDIEAASYGPVLRFTIEMPESVKFVSGNQADRNGTIGKYTRRYKTAKAKRQRQFFADCAKEAVKAQGWIQPDYVRTEVYTVNIDADGDNFLKPFMDSMENKWGGVFYTDRRSKHTEITHLTGYGPPRIYAAFQAVHKKYFILSKPKDKKA